MTRKNPDFDDSKNRLMSARIPWRERQRMEAGKSQKKPRTSRIKSSQVRQVPSTRTAAPSEQAENTASSVDRSARRRSFVRTRPASSGGRNKRSGRKPKDKKRVSQEKKNGRVSFGGVTLSVKAMTVVLLAGLVALLTVPTLAQMWRQQMNYNSIKQRVAATQAANDEMRAELERWKDPTYVAAQARARLGYVRPGETEYMVADPEGKTSLVETQTPTGPAKPWVQILALTMQAADHTDTENNQIVDIPVPETGRTEDERPQSGQQSGGQSGVSTGSSDQGENNTDE